MGARSLDDSQRRELRHARLELLEADNYGEEAAAGGATRGDDDEFFVDDEDVSVVRVVRKWQKRFAACF